MPGFHYRLVCHACGVRSSLYPVYTATMFDTRVVLPGWSQVGRCFLEVIAVLRREEFDRIQTDRSAQRELAAKLSSPQAVVGFPEWQGKVVAVVPEPVCPYCGGAIEVLAFEKADEPDESRERQPARDDLA